MANHIRIFRIIFLAICFLVLPLGLTACGKVQPTKPQDVPDKIVDSTPLTVLSIVGGEVLILKPGETEWIEGTAGITLGVDCKIKTKVNGKASLTFFEGSVIDLEGDTEISIAELGIAGTANTIKLKQTIGKSMSRVKKLADSASRYEIETPATVAAVRGTTMYVAVSENGTTVVGNVEGSAVAIVNGVETPVFPGKHVTVEPGQIPGPLEPGAVPELTPTVVPTIEVPTPTTKIPATPKPTASISSSSSLNSQSAFNGDPITITFSISNNGPVQVSQISVNDDKAGPASYLSGDKNQNLIMDPGEIWLYKAKFTISPDASDMITTIAAISGKDPEEYPVVSSVTTRIPVTPLIVTITPPSNQMVGNVFSLAGTVNDPLITTVTVDLNGVQTSVSVVNGKYQTEITLSDATNTITVRATKAGGKSAATAITFTQATP